MNNEKSLYGENTLHIK